MLLFCLCALVALCGASSDEILDLPGLDHEINFRHYSGFLQVTDNHILHYWFVESQNDPDSDPLVFWFNGGPGCSSLDGLLNELGPYLGNPDGKTLRENPNSWNKLANMVFIESPAGVGYSYSLDGNITTNDDQTSEQAYEAVKMFLARHPSYRHHSTYITGESYGGVYVPTLAARIIDGQDDFPINLKGVAIGNGYMNEKLNIDTSVRFAYGHGLIDQKVWDTLETSCCRGCIDGCDLTEMEGHCATMVEDIFQFLWAGGLNPYDLYRDCDPNPSLNSERMSHLLKGVAPGFDKIEKVPKKGDLLKFLRSKEPLYSDAPCMNDSAIVKYMNHPKVRKALHVPFNVPKWDICSDKVTTIYQKQYKDMAPFFRKIVENQVRVLLYYGDTDMACNFMMGQQFADNLGLKRILKKTPWKYDRQIAGFKTLFKGLTYITVRGAGHMAPQWKAPQMYYVMQQFLLNHPI